MIYGATENSRLENPTRARTITDRMDALGLEFSGATVSGGQKGLDTVTGRSPGYE